MIAVIRTFLLLSLLLSSAMGQVPAEFEPIADVQDYLDTIDQAGLYPMLQAKHTGQPRSDLADIESLYNAPADFRGKLFRFKALLHPTENLVRLGRHTQTPNILYYVIAKIPFKEKRLRLPIILLSPERFEGISAGEYDINGLFYMILRVPTQKVMGQGGPAILDYAVFILDELPQPCKTSVPAIWWGRGPTIALGGTLLLLLLWFVIKYRLKRTGKTLRHF